MMVENNHLVYRTWNEKDVSFFRASAVADFVRYQNGVQTSSDRAGMEELMNAFWTAVPDLQFVYADAVVAGNKTYTEWTASGTNDGIFFDQEPTGKVFETHGLTILTFNEEGLMIQEEAYFDPFSYLGAWGYAMTPPTD